MFKRIKLYKLLKELTKIYILLRTTNDYNLEQRLININNEFNKTYWYMYDESEFYYNPNKELPKLIFKKYNYNYTRACKFINFLVSINLLILHLISEGENKQKQRLAYVLHNLPGYLMELNSEEETKLDIYQVIEKLYLTEYHDLVFADFKNLFLTDMDNKLLVELRMKYQVHYGNATSDIKEEIVDEQYSEDGKFRAVITKNKVSSYSVYLQNKEMMIYGEVHWKTISKNDYVDSLDNAKRIVRSEMEK